MNINFSFKNVETKKPGGHGLAVVIKAMEPQAAKAPYTMYLAVIGNPYDEDGVFRDHIKISHAPSAMERELFAHCVREAQKEKKEIADGKDPFLIYKDFHSYVANANFPAREPLVKKAGSVIRVSCFSSASFSVPKMEKGDIVRLNGLTFDMRPQMDSDVYSKKTVMDENTKQKVPLLLKKQGEFYLSFDVNRVSVLQRANLPTLLSVLKNTKIEAPVKMDMTNSCGTMPGVTILESFDFTKGKEKKLTPNVVVPFNIPTETIELFSVQEAYVIYYVDNAPFILGNAYTYKQYPQLVLMETPKEAAHFEFKKGTEQVPTMILAGRGDSYCTHHFENHEDQSQGRILSKYFSNFINLFGIFQLDHWKMVANALCRSMCFIGVLNIDRNAPAMSEAGISVSLFGISDAIVIDYQKTFSHAGLRVGMKYAEKHLLALQKENGDDSPTLVSKSDDPNCLAARKRDRSKYVPIFWLNNYDGALPAEEDWAVYALFPLDQNRKKEDPNAADPFIADRKMLSTDHYELRNSDDKDTLSKNEEVITAYVDKYPGLGSMIYFACVRKEDNDVFDFSTLCAGKVPVTKAVPEQAKVAMETVVEVEPEGKTKRQSLAKLDTSEDFLDDASTKTPNNETTQPIKKLKKLKTQS